MLLHSKKVPMMAIKNKISKNSKTRAITAIILIITLLTTLCCCPPVIFSTLILTMMSIMIAELKNMIKNLNIFLFILPFYPILPCLILIYFNQVSEYKILLYYLFAMVFSFDTASYIAGKACSKLWKTHKIIPSISPGKSWEGAFGGYLGTALLLLIISKSSWWQTYLLSAVICTIAFAGDVFESFLKRSANIKDSGSTLPGHGGFLDRFDAILFVSVFFFAYKNYLLTFFTK